LFYGQRTRRHVESVVYNNNNNNIVYCIVCVSLSSTCLPGQKQILYYTLSNAPNNIYNTYSRYTRTHTHNNIVTPIDCAVYVLQVICVFSYRVCISLALEWNAVALADYRLPTLIIIIIIIIIVSCFPVRLQDTTGKTE